MNRRSTYHTGHRLSSIFLMLALLWMTVSLPFVSFGQKAALSVSGKSSCITGKSSSVTAGKGTATFCSNQVMPGDDDSSDEEENTCNPFGNSEEKAPSSGINTLTEEYLSHDEHNFHAIGIFLSHHPAPEVFEYVSFHGELLCPPPNA